MLSLFADGGNAPSVAAFGVPAVIRRFGGRLRSVYLVLLSTLLLYFVVQKWGSRRVLFVSSLLASIGFLTISIIAILEYWYSLKSYPLLAWVKCAGLVLSFVCVCSGVVPVMLMRCVEVFPTWRRPSASGARAPSASFSWR